MGRALVRDPKLFLFDEPLSNLDAQLRVDMRTEIKQLHGRIGSTIVYVTHDQIEAMTMASRIAVMNQGEIQQFAAPDEVYNRPANLFVARFLGTPPMNTLAGQAGARRRRSRGKQSAGRSCHCRRSPRRRALSSTATYSSACGPNASPTPAGPASRSRPRSLTTEPTGAETIVLASVAGERLRARVSPDVRLSSGQRTTFIADTRSACLFDPATERLIA